MRRIIFPLSFLILFFVLISNIYADTFVTTGNSYSNTSVTTNVQGSSTTTTHIQSTVNGSTKTLDSNSPGTYTLNNSSDDSGTPMTSPITTPRMSITAPPTIGVKHPKVLNKTFSQNLENFLTKILQKIFSIF